MEINGKFYKEYEGRILIESCPKCQDGVQWATKSELEEAQGCIECEHCGRFLYPVDQQHDVDPDGFCWTCLAYHFGDPLSIKAEQILSQIQRRPATKALKEVCTNQFFEDDGFCVACGRIHGSKSVRQFAHLERAVVGQGKAIKIQRTPADLFVNVLPLWQYDF